MFESECKTSSHRVIWQLVLVLGCLLAVTLVVVACSSSTTAATTSGMGKVSVMLSDPATCQAPDGPFSHVYVTITDVQANVNGSAGSSDSGWVDLTPGLAKAPMQVDLLGLANNHCFLATLGDAQELQAGKYQQIRVILASNSTTVASNMCGSSANCVMLTADTSNTPHTLQLSSEAQTGIKIPSGQIASGGLTVASGQTADLDIDFNTCESIVQEGNGQYRLKPVLHAGEVSTTSTSINGKIVDKATGNPVSGSVMVALEQKDVTGIDRVVMSTMAGTDGSFVFCPLPTGTYDVVVVGTRTDGVEYAPVIVTGVATGSTAGAVDLYLPAVTATSSAVLTGLVTSQNSAMAGTVADVQLSALETVNSVQYTIPLPPTSSQSSAVLVVETAASTASLTCPTGTDCAAYTMQVPSSGAYAGAWGASGTTLTQSSALASYAVDAIATVPSSGGTLDCSPSDITSTLNALTGVGPFSISFQNIGFVQCQ